LLLAYNRTRVGIADGTEPQNSRRQQDRTDCGRCETASFAMDLAARAERTLVEPTYELPLTSTIRFGLSNMGVAPAGIDKANTGHHHLLIDTKLPSLDEPIPNDFNHLHFGAGQTEAIVNLPLGTHTLQLVLGDEIPYNPPIMSKPIRVVVTRTGRRRGD